MLEIDDVMAKLFNPVSSVIISQSYGIYDCSPYGRAIWIGLGDGELHSNRNTVKCNVTLCNFPYGFKSIAKMNKKLEAYSKALFYCKRMGRKAGSYHQHTLTTVDDFETIIDLDE